jgi:hypothetical protein
MYNGHYTSMTIGIAYITTDEELLKKKMYKFYTLTVSDSSVTASVKTFMNASRFIFNMSVLNCQVCFASEDGIHGDHHKSKLMTT